MTAAEQIPKIDTELRRLDAEIGKHIKHKFRLKRLVAKIYRMLDYRDRRIRELGAERSRIATFELDMTIAEKAK